MILIFPQGQRKHWWVASLFLSFVFSVFALSTNAAQARTISYTASPTGCVLGGTNSHRSSCPDSVAAYYNATNVSCSQNTITEFQLVTCSVSGVDSNGTPWNFTATQGMYPDYTCPYGDIEGGRGTDFIPFNCTVRPTDVVSAKNLGGSCSSRTYEGNPIHAKTGNKYAVEADYESTTLEFTRYYNSQLNTFNRHIGIQWRHSYSKRLTFAQNDTDTITFVEQQDGSTLFFVLENDLWVADENIPDQLFELPNGNWQLVTADDVAETYDTNGRLRLIIDRNGRIQTLNYDANERLLSVSDDVGLTLIFTYDGSNRIASMTDPAGGLYQYTYGTNGNLTSVTYPDNKVRTYHYNEPAYTSNTDLPNALTGITDENGVRYATYTYDNKGRAFITEHAGGADKHTLAYSTDGSNTVVTDPLGSQYTRQFQTILGVAKSIGQSQPAGSGCRAASSATTYDVNGNVASRADFNGNKTCFAFDLNRNLEIARVEGLAAGSVCPSDLVNYTPSGNERKTLTNWHIDFRLPTLVTEAQRETSVNYDTYGNVTLLRIRDTARNETRTWNTSYSYHPSVPGVITQRIENGPRTDVSDITTINYYAPDASCVGGHLGCRGQVANIANALGHVTHITRYNAHGQPEAILDPNGLSTTLVYDTRQRLISRIVGTEITDYLYDGVGQVTSIKFPDNSFLTYSYDDAHRLTEIADSLGNTIRYTLDAAGNRTQEDVFDPSNTLTQTQRKEFDALSRLWKNIGAQSQTTEFGYDANGNLKQATNPLQQSTASSFDALNRLIQVNDPLGGQTQQQQDALDHITQVTDPKGITTTYTTNALGDVLQEVSADRGTTHYTYDAAGNQITRTDARGVVETTAYDALNRQISRSYVTVAGVPNIVPITWTYDAGSNGIGQLTGMTDESGNTTYSYDQHGRLLNKTQTVKFGARNFVQTLSYQYDSSGRLSRTIYPSGTQIDTIYGVDGRPAEIKVNGATLIQNITYQPFGEVKDWSWGNGQAHNRSFDLDGRIIQYPIGSDTRTLTYDAASQIIQTSDANPVNIRGYSYDALGRLVGQTENNSFRLWTYDANSNRTSVQSGSNVYPYIIDTNSNRLLDVDGPVIKTYTYDAAGNVINDGITDFTWNAAGRLRKIVKGSKVRKYKYNALGERVRRKGANKRRFAFMYDGAGQLISKFKANNITKENWKLKQETIWLDNIPIAVLKRNIETDPVQVYYIHTDHLNTPRLIVDQSNTPVWRWSYNEAFGANLVDKDPDGDGVKFQYNLRFAGQYFDNETKLHYNYFRYYDPETGRYTSSDPIGLSGGLNTYGYALQNPLTYIDPTGEAPPVIAGIIATAAVAACRKAITEIPKLVAKLTTRTVSKVENITKPGSKLPNIKTNVPRREFEKNLLDNGFTKSASKDGNVNIFSKGDKKFTTRDFSKSTNGPTAEVFKNNKPISKIRLGDK